MSTLLVVDDDPDFLDITTYALRRDGFRVITATDAATALRRWEADAPDLVLVDVGLPGLNGLAVCQRIRAASRTPVIVVTGHADLEHIQQGFRAGADDYVVKPFQFPELVLRIRAVLQRATGGAVVRQDALADLRVGPLTLDQQAHEVRVGEQPPVRLTPVEFRLLHVLAQKPGRYVHPARLVEQVWGYTDGDTQVLRTHLSRVRTKLGIPPGHSGSIVARAGVGYRLVDEEPSHAGADRGTA